MDGSFAVNDVLAAAAVKHVSMRNAAEKYNVFNNIHHLPGLRP